MQKDFHFYVTYLLALRAGIDVNIARKIAWACQFTDELQDTGSHGIQTQSGLLGNWWDRQIQLTVLVAFHFIPGGNSGWVVKPNSSRAKRLVELAMDNDIQLGIALHSLQDTFSHDGFSGWHESVNSCFSWYSIRGFPPSIGHAEMIVVPDIISQVWTDPRTSRIRDNKVIALNAARITYCRLQEYGGVASISWNDIEPELAAVFSINDYDDRKLAIMDLCRGEDIRYTGLCRDFLPVYQDDFVTAARKHLGRAMTLCADVGSMPG